MRNINFIKKVLFILMVNVAIIFLLLGLISSALPIAYDLYKPFRYHSTPSELPNYASLEWAKQFFAEYNGLPSKYFDFIGWRRKAFKGKTITIDESGYRRYFSEISSDLKSSKIWFFGGSAMWGTGARDNETIPAFVQKFSGKTTFNFGETGYVAHQSLNLLMKAYLEGGKPETVVFYDGVNEVLNKCRVGASFFSTLQEVQIQKWVERNSFGHSSFFSVFDPTVEILAKAQLLGKGLGNSKKSNVSLNGDMLECHLDSRKAELITNNLMDDWRVAKFLVESKGGVFIPVLQPVAYIGSPNLIHLPNVFRDDLWKKQYEIVYEKIRLSAKKLKVDYVDMTDVFDVKDFVYIDLCHVSPNGNELVAKRLLKNRLFP